MVLRTALPQSGPLCSRELFHFLWLALSTCFIPVRHSMEHTLTAISGGAG